MWFQGQGTDRQRLPGPRHHLPTGVRLGAIACKEGLLNQQKRDGNTMGEGAACIGVRARVPRPRTPRRRCENHYVYSIGGRTELRDISSGPKPPSNRPYSRDMNPNPGRIPLAFFGPYNHNTKFYL